MSADWKSWFSSSPLGVCNATGTSLVGLGGSLGSYGVIRSVWNERQNLLFNVPVKPNHQAYYRFLRRIGGSSATGGCGLLLVGCFLKWKDTP